MALSKAFRFVQTNRGVALSDSCCAQARRRFTPFERFAKTKLCLSIKVFYAVRIFARLHGGVRIARQPVVFCSSPHSQGRAEIHGLPCNSARPCECGDPVWIP